MSPGAILTDGKRRVKAVVRAAGAISHSVCGGLIHRMGAAAQGLAACNGWTYWHIETAKGLKPIDTLRAQFRAEMSEAAE